MVAALKVWKDFQKSLKFGKDEFQKVLLTDFLNSCFKNFGQQI